MENLRNKRLIWSEHSKKSPGELAVWSTSNESRKRLMNNNSEGPTPTSTRLRETNPIDIDIKDTTIIDSAQTFAILRELVCLM